MDGQIASFTGYQELQSTVQEDHNGDKLTIIERLLANNGIRKLKIGRGSLVRPMPSSGQMKAVKEDKRKRNPMNENSEEDKEQLYISC